VRSHDEDGRRRLRAGDSYQGEQRRNGQQGATEKPLE
jgi:hypothetical protein